MDLLIKVLPGMVAAVLGSFLAAKWSMKKFYSEKWWDRKEHAYVEIVDALYDVLRYCEIKKEDYGQGTGYSSDTESELSSRHAAAYWKIKRATDVGAFVISEEAQNVLRELRDRPRLRWDDNPDWDIYEADYEAHRDALQQIVELARKDLGAKNA
ncbi:MULTISPECIES: hypothetical protein [Halomonas]|uniref:hypothetical protein n=1 Tax=Halomonas TaxID=2745 RepID=UPI001C94426E|nr:MULTISPECIES: hypothetical protein [Halomonas]MBY6209376.1 hypothetical protein [Halomonas sp. DP3Y7-2]MBY6229531.1 hypothetical protein [Halomonas sp. DP3Y7-1]MCA0917410.1 hypothetical protein [Halomonas denitrificans]